MTEQGSPHEFITQSIAGHVQTPLPTLTRRRLYSRLLVASSCTVLRSLGLFVSRFLILRRAAKRDQICFRYNELPYYINLQRSNQFVMVRNTRSLSVGRRLLILIWVMVSSSTVRFVFTSLGWGFHLIAEARVRAFCFFV